MRTAVAANLALAASTDSTVGFSRGGDSLSGFFPLTSLSCKRHQLDFKVKMSWFSHFNPDIFALSSTLQSDQFLYLTLLHCLCVVQLLLLHLLLRRGRLRGTIPLWLCSRNRYHSSDPLLSCYSGSHLRLMCCNLQNGFLNFGQGGACQKREHILKYV